MAAKENSKYYSLGYDRMFKSLIANPQNPKYLNLILTDILEEPVEVVEFLPTEVKVRNKKSKLNILDIIVKTQNNKLLNIELNMRFSPAVKERNLLYYADFYSQSIRRGEKKAENIIHIDINFKGGREEKEDYYVMNNKLEKYSEYFRLIVVNIEKYKEHWFDKNIEGDKEHMYLVMLGLDKKEIEKLSKVDEVIKEVKDKMLILNSDNRIISTISREEKITSLAREEGKEEGIEEGIEIGREKGKEEGIEVGIEIGREKGKEEGLSQAKINIVKNLLKRKAKIKDISEITGLSEEEVNEIISC